MSEPDTSPIPSAAVARNLRLGRSRSKGLLVTLVVALGLVGGVAFGVMRWRSSTAEASAPKYETAKVQRGGLRVTISATGKIQSVDAVDVGAETSGRVEEVFVHFNDVVKAGQPLARINTEQLEARVKEARAQAMVSAASVRSALATVHEAKAKAERMRSLAERGLVSAQDREAVEAAAQRAEASVATARAQQAVSAASVEAAQSNLEKATIRSPIDGIVLARSVEPGQTVASSFQAPVLFTVARGLDTMILLVDVDEADVGQVAPGQSASFTVDAYPGRKFTAKMVSIKNVPTAGRDVVTYEAKLSVPNDERLLRPGMTASATIVVAERTNVLLVPNEALRFKPPSVVAAESEPRGFRLPGMRGMGRPSGSGRPAGSATRPDRDPSMVRVWVLEGGEPKPVRIRAGATDGTNSEVLGDGLTEGTEVLVDVVTGAK
ncbi:MAG: efflux RND transporter periplasmic adaptor subunit [Polyangiaceae bacterium]|jgi:HlyD family secretion protein|nr:efflux RND transporter periplasmic adaptor subunit [Polyangiaceae bacterium]